MHIYFECISVVVSLPCFFVGVFSQPRKYAFKQDYYHLCDVDDDLDVWFSVVFNSSIYIAHEIKSCN